MQQARNLCKILHIRQFCTKKPNIKQVLEHLTNRSLIRVSGTDVSEFLQGLITNDIHHLEHGMGSMYAMFLNTNGRVLYDTLVYKSQEPNTFLLECDVEVLPSLQKHLKMYRVRRKIDVDSLENDFKIYALFGPTVVEQNMVGRKINKNLDGFIVPCDTLNETQSDNLAGTKVIGDMSIYKDPRVAALGSRIIAPINTDVIAEISKLVDVGHVDENKNYRWFRYHLGIGEGILDLPPNNCFPLEANCDYLHGVSFHKGCYIGQELTARTHHTGVVRKRLMPLFLNDNLDQIPDDRTITHEQVNLGKLRGVSGNIGLGLIRIAKAIKLNEIKIGNRFATTGKPNWWPLEGPKEKINVS